MFELTKEQLTELRRIAEAAGDVQFEVAGTDGCRMGINGIPFSFDCGYCGFVIETDQAVVAATPVGDFVSAFDPQIAKALLDHIDAQAAEIERLRRELRDPGEKAPDFSRGSMSKIHLTGR